jgi:cold shock CspA family protein
MKGRVKWWNTSGGYGFIELSSEDSIFISLTKEDKKEISIQENQEIEFEIIDQPNGKYIHILKLQSEA